MQYISAHTSRKLYRIIKRRQRQLERPLKKRDFILTLGALLILLGLFSTLRPQRLISPISTTPVMAEAPQSLPEPVDVRDTRVIKLETYLKLQNSPLADYAQLLVDEADKYDIGYTKLASISKMESSFGKNCPEGSHNAWGWGGSNFIYFESWEKAIAVISQKIGENYKLNEYAGIKSKYCPASDGCNPQWAMIVTDTSHEIINLAVNE